MITQPVSFFYFFCLLPFAYCLLPIAYCLLLVAHCPLLIAYCLLPIAYCLLFIVVMSFQFSSPAPEIADLMSGNQKVN